MQKCTQNHVKHRCDICELSAVIPKSPHNILSIEILGASQRTNWFIFSWIMMKNDHACFKDLAVFTAQYL